MTWLSDVGFFALLFFLLVFIHELGHYLMAKWVGIKVEKFSIGMGPKIFAFQKGETEYRLALLPLGGYVKMAGDDPSKEYSGEEKRRGFLTQKPPAKLLVVFGGPVFNLLLPIFLFAIMLAMGIPSIAPTVGVVQDGMPAQTAGFQVGDRIISLNGSKIEKWTELEKSIQGLADQPVKFQIERTDLKTGQMNLFETTVTPVLADGKSRFGEDIKVGRIGISPEFLVPQLYFEGTDNPLAKAGFERFDRVRSLNGTPIRAYEQLMVALENLSPGTVKAEIERKGKALEISFDVPAGKGAVRDRLGIQPLLLVVGNADESNPAYKAGIRAGDRLISINGKVLQKWEDVSAMIKGSEGKPVDISWSRDGQIMKAEMTPEKITLNDPIMGKDNPLAREAAYRIGVSPIAIMDAEYSIEQSWNPVKWFQKGISQTWEMTSMTLQAMKKLVTGELSLKLLGSPIMIYKVAGNSYRLAGGGHQGWVSFLSTLALLSITLGIVNLFPIPVLDGGHATFFIIEWIRGRPVSLKVMEVAMQVGLFLLICLFAMVLYNDFYRYGWLDSILKLFQ